MRASGRHAGTSRDRTCLTHVLVPSIRMLPCDPEPRDRDPSSSGPPRLPAARGRRRRRDARGRRFPRWAVQPAATARSSSTCPPSRAASPGRTRTRCRPSAICPRPAAPAARSSTSTATAGWTSTWSTAARPTSTRRRRRCATRSTGTIATALSPTSPRRRASPGGSFGMGVAVGDYDNDGYPDLFVTAYGSCTLYHNNGDGTFTDVTKKAGLAAPGWTTSAVWFDYDNDGRLDLFVCSFVEFSLKSNVFCGDNKLGRRYYCIPRIFKPTPSLLFHNNGDGTFTEVSRGTDIAARPRQGPRRRRHRHQQRRAAGSLRRQRHGAELPVRESRQGQVGGDGPAGGSRLQRQRPAALGHGRRRRRTSIRTDCRICSSPTSIRRCSRSIATAAASRSPTSRTPTASRRRRGCSPGWGLKFFDYDNDGQLDLLLANGHPDDMIEHYSTQVKYKEPLLLFRNDGGKLRDVSTRRRAGVRAQLSGARARGRRHRQRRATRRAHLEQRPGAGAAAQRERPGPSLARA